MKKRANKSLQRMAAPRYRSKRRVLLPLSLSFGRYAAMHRALIFTASVVCVGFTNGCSCVIYSTGKHLDVLRKGVDRQAIVECLGEPIAIEPSVTKDGYHDEVFLAKGKIAPGDGELGDCLGLNGQTFGLLEPFLIVYELVRWPYLAAGDSEVRIFFNANDKYVDHSVERAKRRNN
jgi:hypothetical protein